MGLNLDEKKAVVAEGRRAQVVSARDHRCGRDSALEVMMAMKLRVRLKSGAHRACRDLAVRSGGSSFAM